MKTEPELAAAIEKLQAIAENATVHPMDRNRAELFADALLWAAGEGCDQIDDLLEWEPV